MKIGLYVNSLTPKGAAQARFQAGVFEGLRRNSNGRHHFYVLSDSDTSGFKNNATFTYVRLDRSQPAAGESFFQRNWRRAGNRACRLLGWGAGRVNLPPPDPRTAEPAYYEQLRQLEVRLIWLVNGHDLPTWLPFVRTVWEANWRIHSWYPEYSYTRYKFDGLDGGFTLSLAKASYVITGTREGKQQLVSLYGVHDQKVRVIPFPTPILPVGEETAATHSALGFKEPYVFYPARFWPHKNHVVIIAALKILRDKWNLTVNLVLSGADEGNLEYVLNYAQNLGVGGQVKYVGEVPETEIVALYKGSLALVYASAVGPDNLPPLEAMSLGCPVITSDVPGAREQYGEACLFFQPMDEAALASQIKQLLDNPLVREALVANGSKRAIQWSVEDYASSVISIFDEFELVARAWGSNSATFT